MAEERNEDGHEEPEISDAGRVSERDNSRAEGKEVDPPVRPAEGQFVDFDVWVASLEANFGLEFEKVLSSDFGPDWDSMINSRIAAGENFHEMLQELKHGKENPEDSGEGLQENIRYEGIPFEAPGRAETSGGQINGGYFATGSEGPPPLAHGIHKEFSAGDKLKIDAEPEKYVEEKVLLYHDKDSGPVNPDDELVMMDRRDFSRLNYFAHKEISRHAGEEKIPQATAGAGINGRRRAGIWPWAAMISCGLIFLYVLFSLGSYIYFKSISDETLADTPPNLLFLSSTALYKQGGLWLAKGGDTADIPLLVYFYRPQIGLLDLKLVSSPGTDRFEVAPASVKEMAISSGPWGDSVSVRANYNPHLPLNLQALKGKSLLSLSLDGDKVLEAFETIPAQVFPGLERYILRDGAGVRVGEAYQARDRLNILWDNPLQLQGAALDTLATRLVLLFTLLDT